LPLWAGINLHNPHSCSLPLGVWPALCAQKKTSVKISARDIVQAAEHLPSKCKALSSNPSTTKKKKTNQRNQRLPPPCMFSFSFSSIHPNRLITEMVFCGEDTWSFKGWRFTEG
jgi:hypothetical protein